MVQITIYKIFATQLYIKNKALYIGNSDIVAHYSSKLLETDSQFRNFVF